MKYQYGDQFKEGDMGGARGKYGRGEKYIHNFGQITCMEETAQEIEAQI